MAERVGFEPTVGFHLRRISSAVHSTTLPPLRGAVVRLVERGGLSMKIWPGGQVLFSDNSDYFSALSGQGQSGHGGALRIDANEAEKLCRTTACIAGEGARRGDQTGALDASAEVLFVQG